MPNPRVKVIEIIDCYDTVISVKLLAGNWETTWVWDFDRNRPRCDTKKPIGGNCEKFVPADIHKLKYKKALDIFLRE